MIKGFRNFIKTFDQKILSKEVERPKVDFKGKRILDRHEAPVPTREQQQYTYQLDPEIQPQSRKVRFKSLGYGLAFLTWYVGAVYFIMWRLKSDDLDRLEKEAEDRIRIKNLGREMAAMETGPSRASRQDNSSNSM